jgi:hypothetical protein
LFSLSTEEFEISSGWFAKRSKTVASEPILFAYPSDIMNYTVYGPAITHDHSDLENVRVSTVQTALAYLLRFRREYILHCSALITLLLEKLHVMFL